MTDAFACSLSQADASTRVRLWRELRDDALLDERRDGDLVTARWRRTPESEARLRALVEAERACCPFLAFELDGRGEALVLRTTFPPGLDPAALLGERA